eukprot:TRINITY_DN28658_c0_g2_i2.p1 TRINITY_DN28658_c0_g2~~TRINITY_DN28658_c0_g2_i2.p1  ORF type:complete len:783 (+),score=281.04 TRINITY_DN28658_c0_g2_i2:246-2594(+)
MTLFNVSLQERTGRVETQLLELENRRRIRKEFFPFHLEIIEAAARASVHATLPMIENDSSDEFEYESNDGGEVDDHDTHGRDEASIPAVSPVNLPEQHLVFVDTIFQLFDISGDGFWCMTEANRWMCVMENQTQTCDIDDWEVTCQSAQCDPTKGLDLEAVRQWYRTAGVAEKHFETILDESGEPDPRHAQLSDTDLHRLDTMLEYVFREFDIHNQDVWDEESGNLWLDYLGWFDTWKEACDAAEAAGDVLTKEHVALLYGANEYLLTQHYTTVGRWKERNNEGNTFNAEDDEDEGEYCVGGYHRVAAGDVYHDRYEILRKLGWGNFSTVWLAKDLNDGPPVALKIGKGANAFREMSELEVDVLQKTNSHYEKLECDLLKACAKRLVRMTDFFNIQGPHGTHPTMALEAVGPDILKLLTAHDFAGVAPCIVKTLIKHMLEGIAFLHDMGLAHADIKPENVLIQTIAKDGSTDPQRTEKLLAGKLDRPEGMPLDQFMKENYACKVSDFGSSKWVNTDKSVHPMQTLEYRAPEVVLGYSPGVEIDIWSVACTCFELLSGCFLFNPKASQNALSQEANHISLYIKTLGPIPDCMVFGGGRHCDVFFAEDGHFRYGHVKVLGLREALVEKFGDERIDLLEDFLTVMLKIDNNERMTALEAMNHPWLKVVEGDDVPLVKDRDDEGSELDEPDAQHMDDEEEEHLQAEQAQPRPAEAARVPEPAVVAQPQPTQSSDTRSVLVEGKALVMLTLRHRADYADLRRDELVERRKLRTSFFPKHLEAIKVWW